MAGFTSNPAVGLVAPQGTPHSIPANATPTFATTYYVMRAIRVSDSAEVFWIARGAPDPTGAQAPPGTGAVTSPVYTGTYRV